MPNEGGARSWTGSVVDPWEEESFSWIEINGIGTQVWLDDDDVSQAIALDDTFGYYGHQYTSLYIGSNGYTTFTPYAASLTIDSIPTVSWPNNAVYSVLDGSCPGERGRRLLLP